MSCSDHEGFKSGVRGLNGEQMYYTTACEQVERVKRMTDLKQLWAIAGDRELGVSVRKAAERRARVVEKNGKHGPAQTITDGHAEGAV